MQNQKPYYISRRPVSFRETERESELVEKEAKESKGSEGERKWGLGEGPSCCRYWQWVWG